HTRCLSDWSSDVCSSDLSSRFVAAPAIFWLLSSQIRAKALTSALRLWKSHSNEIHPSNSRSRSQTRKSSRRLSDQATNLITSSRSEERRVGKVRIGQV